MGPSWRWLTPPGAAAVAVLELCGEWPELVNARGERRAPPAPGRVVHAWIADEGRVLDEVVAVGDERGGELHVHGSAGVASAVERWLARRGWTMRPAPDAAAPLGRRQMRALLSARHGPLAELLRELRAALAAASVGPALRRRAEHVASLALLAERLVRPARVALVGPPNVGKSTLFNAWLGETRVLVSPQAGTTRDPVAVLVLLRGVAVELCDTAGSDDPEAAARALGGTDLLIQLVPPAGLPSRPGAGLRVASKADLALTSGQALRVSGLTGAGLPELQEAAAEALGIPLDESEDVLAPVDPALRRVLRAALAR